MEVTMTEDVLKIFSEPTAGWFAETFGKATKVQEEAWPAIAAGKPVLVSAPHGYR
jgi:ATP-dependent helicase Lhr and Lhr-like helicase